MYTWKTSQMEREQLKLNSRRMLLLYLIILTSLKASIAEEIPGFLNIDCGSGASAPYEDPQTKLTWENDDRFTEAGMNGNVSCDDQALSTFRYFPKQQKKHCYELTLTRPNTSFLIRAMFFYDITGELDSLKTSEFDLAINATVWYTVFFDLTYDYHHLNTTYSKTVTAEGIFFSPGQKVDFCLIEVHGVSFISSLELRELDRDGMMYSFDNSQRMCFIKILRSSFTNSPYQIIRYPDDPYDRFWDNNAISFLAEEDNASYISNSSVINTDTSADVNYIPTRAMLNAALFGNGSGVSIYLDIDPLGISLADSTSGIYTGEIYVLYLIFYFQDLTSSQQERGNFTISINALTSPSLNAGKNRTTMYADPGVPYLSSPLEVKIENENKYESPFLLNAIEAYQQRHFDFTTTSNSDDKAIKFLRKAYSLKDWERDPCNPVPLRGLSCQIDTERDNVTEVYSVNLSNLGRPINLSSSIKDDINFLGLSNWSLTNSNVNNGDFEIIYKTLLNPRILRMVDLSYNNITEIPRFASWTASSWFSWPEYLNFSNNKVSGELMLFDTVYGTLIEL